MQCYFQRFKGRGFGKLEAATTAAQTFYEERALARLEVTGERDSNVNNWTVDDIQGSATESTDSLVVSTISRDGGTVSFQSQMDTETFAQGP